MVKVIRPTLTRYIPMADMLVQTFGGDCEVVLHDLSDPQHSVVYVANDSVTGRKIGENFDQLIKQVILSNKLKDDFVANYYFRTKDGRLVRSSTLLIKDEEGQLEGALCINLDTTKIARQIDYLQSLMPTPVVLGDEETKEKENDQENDVTTMVTGLIDKIIGDDPPHSLNREDRIEKIRFMESKGIFMMKGSIEQVAKKLGVNKVTIYSYLDEVRGKR